MKNQSSYSKLVTNFLLVIVILSILVLCKDISKNAKTIKENAPSTSNSNKYKKYDYTKGIQNSILKLYPDATFSLVDFREWEAGGLTMQENSFKYTNIYNQECKSTYLARCCMGELVYLRIDETVVYSDPDRTLELMEMQNE